MYFSITAQLFNRIKVRFAPVILFVQSNLIEYVWYLHLLDYNYQTINDSP